MKPPETLLIAITFADDTVGIMAFVCTEYAPDNSVRWSIAPTPDAVDKEIARTSFDKEKLPVRSWRYSDARELPEDRTFRDAWRDSVAQGKKAPSAQKEWRDKVGVRNLQWSARQKLNPIVVDMPAAREIHRDNMRHARASRWPEVDAEVTRALAAGKAPAAKKAEAKRQVLRDVTEDSRIEKAKTPEQLAAVWPEELGENPWRKSE